MSSPIDPDQKEAKERKRKTKNKKKKKKRKLYDGVSSFLVFVSLV